MNKTRSTAAIIALMLVPALAFTQPAVTSDIDASIRLGIGLDSEPDTDLSFRNFASRVRWAASADIDENLEMISYLEFGFDQDEGIATTRHAWVGVKSGFGAITVGKQYSAFYDAVTSKVDIAYWQSCLQEIACDRESSVLKFVPSANEGLQFIASVTMKQDNELSDGSGVTVVSDDPVDGFDIAAEWSGGDITYGVGLSYLGDRLISVDGIDALPGVITRVDSGLAMGLSAVTDVFEGTASALLQLASDDYAGGEDNAYGLTVTYTRKQVYAVASLLDAGANSPFYLTGGYVRPLIENQALVYFEAGVADSDIPGTSANLQGRAVLVFNFGKHSASAAR